MQTDKIEPVGPFQGLNGKWGFIDRDKGGWIVEPKFDKAWDFHSDMAEVEVDGKIGFINIKGELIWKPQFDIYLKPIIPYVNRFYGDIGFIIKNNRLGFIKSDGTWIVQPEYRYIKFLYPGGSSRIVSIFGETGKEGDVILKDNKLILEVKKGVLRRPLKENLL